MNVQIRKLTLGIAATNSYVLADTDARIAIVIDPVDNAALLKQTAEELGCIIGLVVATHGHYDHVLASQELKELTGAPFYVHQKTPQVTGITGPLVQQLFPPVPKPDRLLADETELIEMGSLRLQTLFTPGHAPDHVCYYLPDHGLVFGGDCLFAGSIGRTDLPFGDHETLMASIFTQLIPLGDKTRVLPGHMQPTTIGQERATNPFLQNWRVSDHPAR